MVQYEPEEPAIKIQGVLSKTGDMNSEENINALNEGYNTTTFKIIQVDQ